MAYYIWHNVYDDGGDLAATVSRIGSNEGTILISYEIAVTADLTIPANITLKFIEGGIIDIASGKTLTINGKLEAGTYQIFKGSGSVSLAKGSVIAVYPHWWGAKVDGVTNDSAAFNAAGVAAKASGAWLDMVSGTYLFSSQVTIDGPAYDRLCIFGYGAEIKTSGAISGIKFTGGSTTGGISGYGLKINHRDNSTATYGFDIFGAWNVRLYDPTVEAHGVSGTYAAFHIGNSDPSDNATGSLWTKIYNPWVRKRSGGDSGNITIGVLLEGSANATTIQGGGLNDCVTGVKIQNHSGYTYLPNSILILGIAFETYTTAVHVAGATTSSIDGHRYIGNRFENGTTVFSYTGTTTQPATPPYMCGNTFVSNAGTYLNNPNSLVINSLDMSTTPDLSDAGMKWTHKTIIRGRDGATEVLELWPIGGNKGIVVKDPNTSNTVCAAWWSGTANQGIIRGNSSGTLGYLSAKGISRTTTGANNLRGSATFSSSGTVAVTFGTAEPDTSYFIVVTGDVQETFWVTSKATSGFTINSSNASSTATVDWILIR